MASGHFSFDAVPVINDSANPVPGARLTFFEAGTSVPITVYADPELTTPLTNPVIADAGGRLPDIFGDGTQLYDVRVATSADVQIDYRLSVRPIGPGGEVSDAQVESVLETVLPPLIDDRAFTDLNNATFLPEGSAALNRSVIDKIRETRSIDDRQGATTDAKLRAALAANSADQISELISNNARIDILSDLEIPPGIDLVGKDRSPGERFGVGNFAAEKNLIVLHNGASISYCPERSSMSGFTIMPKALYDALPWANETAALAGIAAFSGTAIKLYGSTRPGSDEAAGTAVLGSGGSAGQVVSVTITDAGANYDGYVYVRFSGGGATTQATGTVNLTGGQISSVTINSGGSGYTSAPTVTFYVGGADCELRNLLIIGFNQAVDAVDIDRLRCVDVKGDCTNGIKQTNSFDVSDKVRCRFWPFTSVHIPEYGISWELTKRTGTAFLIDGVGDWTNEIDCFSFGYEIGTDINGPSHVLCHNTSHDNASSLAFAGRVTTGIRVRGSDTRNITLSMCRTAGQARSIQIDMSGTLNPVVTTIGHRSWGAVLTHCKFDRGIWNDIGSQWEAVPGFEIGNNFTIADTITAANLSLTYPSNPAISASATAMAKICLTVGGINNQSVFTQTDHRSTLSPAADYHTGVAGYWRDIYRITNGTAGSPTDVIAGNVPGEIAFQGWGGGGFRDIMAVRCTVTSISGTDVRGSLSIRQTLAGSTTDHTRFKPNGGWIPPQYTGDPTSPEDGEMYYNATTKKLRYYNGATATWADV